MSWAEYTQAARELAELRRVDAEAQADRRSLASTAQSDLEKITKHLGAQRDGLKDLAKSLRLPDPWFGRTERSSVTDLPEALHRAADAANAADVAAREAEDAAVRPPFLPDLSPTVRNAVIYSGAAAVGWLFQCGLSIVAPETEFGVIAWSLCGLPAVAFFAGYILVSTVGQPRVRERDHPKNPTMGGVICFGGMLLAWIALKALASIISA